MAESLDGSRSEDVQNKRRKCFYNNLLLLEFNESYMVRKYKIPFNKDIFLVPNKKGFEVITHFLFTKLNEAIGKEEYKFFWPIFNKEQSQEFRRTAHSYLNKVSQNSTDISFPQIVPSLFLSPGGERFYELYLAFSTYVLQQFIGKDGQLQVLLLPPLTSQNSAAVQNILELSTISLFREFAKCQRASLHLHNILEENAKDLIECYRNNKQILQDKRLLLKKHIDTITSSHIDNGDQTMKEEILKIILQKSKLQLERVKKNWVVIEDLLAREKDYWEIVRMELKDESSKKYILDGREYMAKMPESISQELIPELEKMKIHSLYKDGKLCIISFISLLIVCLEYYIKLLHRGCFPKVNNVKQLLENTSETVKRNIAILKFISGKIASEISLEMKQNISQLESSALLMHEEKINEKCMEIRLPHTLSRISLPPSISLDNIGVCNTSVSLCNSLNRSAVEENGTEIENKMKMFADEFNVEVTTPLRTNKESSTFKSTQSFVEGTVTPVSPYFLGHSLHKQDPETHDLNSSGNSWIEEEIFSATLPCVPLFD